MGRTDQSLYRGSLQRVSTVAQEERSGSFPALAQYARCSFNHVSPFSSNTRNPNESQPSVTQTQTTLALVPNDNPTPLARTYVGTVHSLTARSRGLLPTSYDTIEGPFHMQTGYLDSALAVQYICIPPLEMKFPGSKSKSHFLAIAYPACYERFTPGDPLRSQGQMSSLFRRQLCPRIL